MRRAMQAEAQHPVDPDSTVGGVLVACIGNELVADDALGFEVYNALGALSLPRGVVLHYASVGGLSLMDHLVDGYSDVIIVDAVRFGAPVGTIHCLRWDELPDFSHGAVSGHTIGLRDTVEIARLLYPEKVPGNILLVGVEGRCFDRPREAMSPEVAGAISPTVAHIRKLIHLSNEGHHEEIDRTGTKEQTDSP